MKYRRLIFATMALSCLSILGCNKEKKTTTDINPIDIHIEKSQAIQLGALTIYPISSQTPSSENSYLIFNEILETKGFNVKKEIAGNGTISFDYTRKGKLFYANKSEQAGCALLGDISLSQQSNYYILQDAAFFPAKKIIQVDAFSINRQGLGQNDSFRALFPCPPTPLRYLLQNQTFLATNWLKEGLPLLNYEVDEDYELNSFEFNLFDDNDDEESTNEERIEQENLGSEDHFIDYFAPIADNHAVGCLVTYKDSIVVSYLFAQADIFKKEWFFIQRSIYLNQLMGYNTKESSQHTPFLDTQTTEQRLEQLWTQGIVLPKDKAYLGKKENQPFYLVAF